ncbi:MULTISPECIES: efflux RND transporter periplasmic adaptor subunit [unclassified Dyella]|uniref:efflux RND transporter periplasmic adaptor subunit n=1 Tax=unclassified Dyella TaxID=2634549 RepID=UPI000C85C1AE|nr:MULTISPECIES: efflux RND transporter periplasmic adaptor subunit [unclassified Dyella]MDR3447789.1 efflux RND transporter periplasmic adaptor subunit [Dyella sp.]PMQ03526.1 Cobalt-zinc-cadmium resistance protein CzcB [Dyella sp. AD56]
MKKHQGRLIAGGCLLAAILLAVFLRSPSSSADTSAPAATAPKDPQNVTINEQQAHQVRVAQIVMRDFTPGVDAVGYVDFNQDRLAQVNSPYAGRVREVFAKAGDAVKRGQSLFSVDSPDLAQAEATLVGAAASRVQTTAALERAKGMAQAQANAPRDVEQAVSDQQTAEGNYQAARRALHIFGKSDADIDRIAATRRVDGELRIDSPIDGHVSARTIAAGDLVQPGNSPAPFTISDDDSLWLVANVSEDDATQVHVGDVLSATLPALSQQAIKATVDYVGNSSDAATHRVTLRSILHTPPQGLRPQMLANYRIFTAPPARHEAVPADAVVREGTGAMVVFTTSDGLRFTRCPVQLGPPQDGYYPVLSGLPAGQRIATEGALFLSNALALQSQ